MPGAMPRQCRARPGSSAWEISLALQPCDGQGRQAQWRAIGVNAAPRGTMMNRPRTLDKRLRRSVGLAKPQRQRAGVQQPLGRRRLAGAEQQDAEGVLLGRQMVRPPSTGSSTPVMNSAASLASQSAALAMSCGVDMRPSAGVVKTAQTTF